MPPKTAAANKNRTLEGYVSNTNASGANSGGANAKANAGSPEALSEDNTYAVCKEMCQEISSSILEKIDQRFDAFETRFQSLYSEQSELKERMDSQEQATGVLDQRVELLEANFTELTKHAEQLQTKLHDLEARSRRHNIKIVGIPENAEDGRPTDFVSKLIPELLGREHFPNPVKIDRAHRTLQPKPAAGAKPRTILARIHHFQEKEMILRLSREKRGCEFKGNKILLFPDYTSEVMSQRRAFADVMQALRGEGIRHSLRYPARLHVYWRDGEKPTIFNDAKEAVSSLERRKATQTRE